MFFPVISLPVGIGIGFVAGAFTPAIGRKIKALFVKDTAALKADAIKAEAAAKAAEVKVAASVAADAKAAAAKV
jgi:hypothetical protein